MDKMVNIMEKRLLLLLLLPMIILVHASSMSGSITLNAKVSKSSVGCGKVYASADSVVANNAEGWKEDSSTIYEKGRFTKPQTKTWFVHAQPEDGYYLQGWYEGDFSENETTLPEKASSELHYEVTQTADQSALNPSKTYTAIFKHYVYGYTNGRSAQISEGAEYGEISLDNTTYSAGPLSEAVGDNKTLKQDEAISLTYYARLKEGMTGVYFKGWFDDQGTELSKDLTFTYKFYPTSEDSSKLSQVPMLYAKFGKRAVYKNSATAKVVVADAEGKYIEVSEGNAEHLNNVGGVYVNSNRETKPAAYTEYAASYTFGDGAVTPIENNESAGNYDYTYRAQAKEGWKFVGWATTLPANGEKIGIINTDIPYICEHYTDVMVDANAPTPTTLYAVFSQNTYYFYKGAIAGFAENGEKGKITVTGQYYNEAKKDEEQKTYSATTTDAIINNSGSIYNTALNVKEYSYTYKAENTAPDLMVFKGWSRSPRGGNLISTSTEFNVTYSTSATTAESAETTAPLYAVFQSYWYKNPVASALGAGQVAAEFTQAEPQIWQNSIVASDKLNQVPAEEQNSKYSVYYYAKPNFGAYFKGWSQVADGSQLLTDNTQNPYKVDYTVAATDDELPFASARLYAVFESVIQVIQKDRMIYYVDADGRENINDANVIVNFNKAKTLKAELKNEHGIFEISDKQRVDVGSSLTLDASSGIVHLVLSYKGSTPKNDIGKRATITISSEYTNAEGVTGTATIDLEITIEEKPYVSFLPTDGKGAYTIKHTDGRGMNYTMAADATDNIAVDISQENMATFELSLTSDTEDDGLTFAGWQMIVDEVATYISYEKKCTYSFGNSAFVRPVFLADDRAVFTILGDEYERKYFDLQQALNDAKALYDEKGAQQTVVFSNDGKVEGHLYQGNYIVPSGVTLLIPGVGPDPLKVVYEGSTIDDPFLMRDEADRSADGTKNNYVCRYKREVNLSADKTAPGVLTTADYLTEKGSTAGTMPTNAPNPLCYRKLIVEDGTSIKLESGANMELYAVLNRSGQAYEAQPFRYGQVDLGENCRIDVEQGAALYAFGYITGAESSRITAQSGAEVHELFRYSDPRGGSGVAHLYLYREYYRVFPFSQYYLQNVEVPMELKAGATEYVTTTADVLMEYVVMCGLIIPTDAPAEASGLFRLGPNSSFIKYYDPITDRQKFVLKGETDGAKVDFGIMDIQMGDVTEGLNLGFLGDIAAWLISDLKEVGLNSAEYVLPLNNNMDIILENVNVSTANDFAFLAGSTLTIDENSTLTLNGTSKIYLYDAEQNLLPQDMWTAGKDGNSVDKYAAGTGYFSDDKSPLCPISSTPNNTHLLLDKKIKKRLPKDVKDAKWVVDGKVVVTSNAGLYTTEGGAQIVSRKNGQVTFEKGLSNTVTYQAKYASGAKIDLIEEEGTHNRAEYTVNPARLLNANGSYTPTDSVQNTFTYAPAQGVWLTDASKVVDMSTSEIVVTLPDYDLATDQVDALSTTLTSKFTTDIDLATIAWNGGSAQNATITSDVDGKHITISYTPTGKAGEYEGLITLNKNVYYQRITVVEDYTPRFSAIEKWDAASYIGYSAEVVANIKPEDQNVAGILSGKYVPVWSYDITGANADEFQFLWGEGDSFLTGAKIVFKPKTAGSKVATLAITCTYTDAAGVVHTTSKQVPLTANVRELGANSLAFADGVESIFINDNATALLNGLGNGQAITITPETNDYVTITEVTDQDGAVTAYTISPKTQGAVTITVTQAPDLVQGIAGAEITKTITVTDDIVWNWDILYFGSENSNPVTTKYEKWNLEIAEDEHDVIFDLIGDESSYIVKVQNWKEGEAEVTFTMTYGDNDATRTFTSKVYRDPRHLPLGVTDNRIYEAVTWAFDKAGYTEGDVAVDFTPQGNQVAQWSFMFFGIPDQLTFNAKGGNNWQIEESANGQNWSIAYTWAPISNSEPFALNLQPSTRYIRISYAVGNSPKGQLSNIAVSELTSIKSDIEKLYMPVETGVSSSTKSVVFTYVSEDGYQLTTSHTDIFTANPTSLQGTANEPFYIIERVEVTSTASEEMTGTLNVDGTQTSVPIKTFLAPQAIPIQLASDHDERYYYVVSNSYQTSWDAASHAVVMQNAVADASPYVVFHFADAPTPGIVSFNYSAISASAHWLVQESSDATNWVDLPMSENEAVGSIMRKFQYPETSRYLRITLVSDYAEVVALTNVSILPSANVVVNPASLTVYDDTNEKLSVTTNNLQDVTFSISENFSLVDDSGSELTSDALTNLFVGDGSKTSDVYVKYSGSNGVLKGALTITSTKDAQGVTQTEPVVLATVELLGVKRTLTSAETGIYTGVDRDKYEINGFEDDDIISRQEVKIASAFASTSPLFDYLIIYGETTTTDDDATTITKPTSTLGSNAQTPCYIYKNIDGKYTLQEIVDNANSSRKSFDVITIANKGVNEVDSDPEQLKVYITGFCPYASTGYTKADNGVWHFKGDAGDIIDIYLENCYIYSRYKTKRGNSFTRENGETYSDKVARGSGAVLLFENNTSASSATSPMKVTIHTRGSNLLKSHYGCLYESFVGRAFQISAPVQIYMQSEAHFMGSKTELNFTDEWPTAADASTTERTNGFLSLQKQVNNAPSIDMGNANTVVNFRGGRVELQNALNSSDNYESTLAISYRTGIYGPAKFKFVLSKGIGTDGTDGRVNFYDGTTTVIPMTVPERYRQYYLMDTDADGNELSTTSCLRTPMKTFVYGGSHCMMRACPLPTDKGGAPTDGDVEADGIDDNGNFKYKITGNPLGLYEYTGDTTANGSYGLVTPKDFPGNLANGETKLSDVHANYPENGYGVNSIAPVDGKLNFWIPAGYVEGVAPEVNATISYWKACMTYIAAKYATYEGEIGGDTQIAFSDEIQSEEVYNLLYCQIDDKILDVITKPDYSAPVLNPAPTDKPDERYLSITPTQVGTNPDDPEIRCFITTENNYKVENKVYYIVPAQADIWMAFTAPFDVEKVYVMETYDENELADLASKSHSAALDTQATHNADFAAFFGVALALESKKDFNSIFNDYMGWAKQQDNHTSGTYTKRGRYELEHYYLDPTTNKTNWATASYYLNENSGPWVWDATNEVYVSKNGDESLWRDVIPQEGQPLMQRGKTYSMLFPWCVGCDETIYDRDYWDYWTGKFLIFESTDGGADGHTIYGANYVADNGGLFASYTDQVSNQASLLGNPSFAEMKTANSNVWNYIPDMNNEGFMTSGDSINPTESFLLSGLKMPTSAGKQVRILRDGRINYGSDNSNDDNVTTGGNMPTLSNGGDLFVTSIAEGVNIAVAEPQQVSIFSSTGALIFSGWIETSADINLVTNGVYVAVGENCSVKFLY